MDTAIDLNQLHSRLEEKKRLLEHRASKMDKHLRPDVPLSADFQEQAVELENEEVLSSLSQSSRVELSMINRALQKIANGEYGYCEVCDGEISPSRLKAVPYATMCIECAEENEKEQKRF